MNINLEDLDLAPAAIPSSTETMGSAVLTPVLVEPEPLSQEEAIARETQSWVERAKTFAVDSPASYEQAGQMIDQLKAKKKDVEGFFAPLAEAAHKAWKALTTRRASLTDPLDEAIAALSSRYVAYARQVREAAEREQRERERIAQEQERKRLQAEAEAREREAAEARKAAELATSREEAVALAQQADLLVAEAEQARVEAVTAPPPVVAPVAPAVDLAKGPTTRANWTFRVTDKMALIKAVAAGQVSPEALEVNEVYLRARARADKATCVIPGVQVYDAGTVVASRGRK